MFTCERAVNLADWGEVGAVCWPEEAAVEGLKSPMGRVVLCPAVKRGFSSAQALRSTAFVMAAPVRMLLSRTGRHAGRA